MANENRQGDNRGRESLQAREYRGGDGQIHHHSKTYMHQHGETGRSEPSGGEETRRERGEGREEERRSPER